MGSGWFERFGLTPAGPPSLSIRPYVVQTIATRLPTKAAAIGIQSGTSPAHSPTTDRIGDSISVPDTAVASRPTVALTAIPDLRQPLM